MSSLLARRRLEQFNWAVIWCFGWYHYEIHTGVFQSMPGYRRHEQGSAMSTPVCRVSATTWTMENAAEKMELARKRSVIRVQLVAGIQYGQTERMRLLGPLCQHRVLRWSKKGGVDSH